MATIDIPAANLQKGVILAALAAFSYGAGAVFVRFAYQAGVLPGTAVVLRFIIAAIVLFWFLVLSGSWVSLAKHQIIPIFLLGFFGFSIMGITFYVALSLIPAWLVALITALYPLLTNIGGWLFLKDRITPQQAIALLAVLAGGVLLFIQPFKDIVWSGVLLMFLNSTVIAAYLLIGQRWIRGVPPMMSAVWTVVGAAVCSLMYALFSNELSLSFAPVGWIWVLCFAVISTAFAIMSQWWSISLIGASRTSIIGSFESLSAVLMAVLILGESLTLLQSIGGVFILAGMFLVQWRPR